MTFEVFEKKIDKLRNNNPDLIDAYESKMEDSLDDCMQDLFYMYDKLTKIKTSADPISTVQEALYIAIRNNTSVVDAYDTILASAMKSGNDRSTLQMYFKELGEVYDKNGNNYNIVYCPENRDRLIEMNLKTVISIAKGYQGLGLSLEELISAGNLGLVTAFDKYDPNRAKLKDDMLARLADVPDDADRHTILQRIYEFMQYGDIKKNFLKQFGVVEVVKKKESDEDPEDFESIDDKPKSSSKTKTTINLVDWKDFTKADVIRWIGKNVQNATFNSVAFMWIRAFILIEIDTNSRLVKKPKSEIYGDKLKYGAYKKEVTLDIDAPVNDDGGTSFGDILYIEDDKPTELDVSEAYDTFKDGLNKLLDGVKPRDRSVFLKKFGIGLPRPMLPKEIAEQENLSIARISQIFQSVVEQMQKNAIKHNINPDVLFEAAKNLE